MPNNALHPTPKIGAAEFSRYVLEITMFKIVALFTTYVVAILSGCVSQQANYVAPNSEMGALMAAMDAKGRFHQNVPRMNARLSEYENESGCVDIEVKALVEPGERVSNKVYLYEVIAASPACGEKRYLVKIGFRDSARTLMKKFEILERVQ